MVKSVLLLAMLGAAAAFALRWSVVERAGSSYAPGTPILFPDVDRENLVTQIRVAAGVRTLALRCESEAAGPCTVASNNERVLRASVHGDSLRLIGLSAGRAGLRIETAAGRVRHVGVRVVGENANQSPLPDYLPVGQMSEDTSDHLNYWRNFEEGERRYVDMRYLYLNGGPNRGWSTWGSTEGSRAVNYIRNSRTLGMVPFFVWYNLVESDEGPGTATANVRNPRYMESYFRSLELALRLIQQESPDDVTGMILEPDFLGYIAQAGQDPGHLAAAVQAAYDAGILSRTVDPVFPNTVQGFVEAVNYLIHKRCPRAWFGWQVNLWASPAGGWVAPPGPKGIIHATEAIGITAGRRRIAQEAAAIADFYRSAGVLSHGAKFVVLDKYGLDAAGVDRTASTSPASATWFWNSDLWGNYLTFVKALHEHAGLPVVLWQIPVGHVNDSPHGNAPRAYEDSAATYFFGGTFTATGPRLQWFGQNRGGDPGVSTQGHRVTWRAHMDDAAASGVMAMLFGPGTAASTTAIGANPGDGSWWMKKAQTYLDGSMASLNK